MWYNNSMADITAYVQTIQIGGKMKEVVKKIGSGVLVLIVSIAIGAGVIYVMHNTEVAQAQEEARQQEQMEARDELQQLKGKVKMLQFLSCRTEFLSDEQQEELDRQLRSAIEQVEQSDNQYLQEVSIPIEETSVFVACDGVNSYINHWISEIG